MRTQGKTTQKERFIESRAEGLSYDDIASQLGVSKPTLIGWAKELSVEIQNARAIRMDGLLQRFTVAKDKRVEAFGKRLQDIMSELDTRDLATVPTATLLSLALKYGEHLRAEDEPIMLSVPGDPLDFDLRRVDTFEG